MKACAAVEEKTETGTGENGLEARVGALETAVREVLAKLEIEAAQRTRLARVAYVFGGVFAGAVAEALRGAVHSSPDVARIIAAWVGG